MSIQADLWELSLTPRVQRGRGRELAGLMASGGEQLAVALAALVEAKLWNSYRRDNPPDLDSLNGRVVDAAQEMTQRAMADLAAYYLLAIGHTVANVTIRSLALDSQLHPLMLDVLGSWCPVGSRDPRDWLSLNKDTARLLRRLAKRATTPARQNLAEPATALVLSEDWQELDQLRGAHYHRRRPQSAGLAGAPLTNPWTVADGIAHADFGGGHYVDGDGLAQSMTNLARRVTGELTSVMDQLRHRVEAAMENPAEGTQPRESGA